MDEVFDSGLPAWKSSKIRSARLEQLTDEMAREPKPEPERVPGAARHAQASPAIDAEK